MIDGWIKLYRQIWENPISTKPLYLSVFLYMISHANYKDNTIIMNNKNIHIKKGSYVGSIRKISEHFNVSSSTIKYVIDYLVTEQMIEHEPNTKFSVFKINKYEEYQGESKHLNTELNTNRTQADTTKKEKKKRTTTTYVDIPLDDIVEMYRLYLPELKDIRMVTDKRKRKIKKLWNRYEKDFDIFTTVFRKVSESKYLLGENKYDWMADFDWIIDETNFEKILEDYYVDKNQKDKKEGDMYEQYDESKVFS